MRCALLAEFPWDFASQYVLSTPNVHFGVPRPELLGLPALPNPFALPDLEAPQVVLLSTYWTDWLTRVHPDRSSTVLDRLANLPCPTVGLDATDSFALGFVPRQMERFQLVLKAQGVYRDRELYNYQVGVRCAGGNWTDKRMQRTKMYTAAALEKIRLSVPCMMREIPRIRSDVRARTVEMGIAGDRPLSAREVRSRAALDAVADRALRSVPVRGRRRQLHRLFALTHLQRLDALELLREYTGTQGISMMPSGVEGADHDQPASLQAIEARAAPFLRSALARPRFVADLCQHKLGFAPCGYGEITFRHAEVLLTGAALVCQSLAHVETMFPFEDGRNVVFCRPDLRDLREVIDGLLADDAGRRRVARAGRRDFREWSLRWPEVLRRAVELPLREALGEAPARSFNLATP